ncbi:hypothetical protein Q4I30_006455 [Leishmania utingensis]|uniref:Uncharacterized protein n=1 Tax=Leishmania utingensis TaxID=653362 RepID=A0AAW3A6C5_9TRYP
MSDQAPPPLPVERAKKENLNYEGRVRAENHKDELVMNYTAYLAAHPEITPLLQDIVQHVLVLKPARPLEAMRAFVEMRSSSSV